LRVRRVAPLLAAVVARVPHMRILPAGEKRSLCNAQMLFCAASASAIQIAAAAYNPKFRGVPPRFLWSRHAPSRQP
jgi:hypothetical protein